MKVFRTFLIAELIWAAGIFTLMATAEYLSDGRQGGQYVMWLARAVAVAALPAGITISADVFAGPGKWRPLIEAVLAAALVAAVAFLLMGVVAAVPAGEVRSLGQLAREMRDAAASWEARNDAAWRFYVALLQPLQVLLFAAIGVQVGIWTRYALPPVYRRVLWWAVGLGLLVSGFGVSETTYESIILHVNGDASFAAFYTVLVPLSICAGLALPTLALLRGADVTGGATGA